MKKKSLSAFKKDKNVKVLTKKQTGKVQGGQIGIEDISDVDLADIGSADIENL